MLDIIQDYIPSGRRNRPGRANPMQYITIHNTGNSNKGANARSHANYIKSDAAANAPVSWHYTVDEAGAYQHLPDNEDAFHAGDGSGHGNRRSIGIEICMDSGADLLKATDNAAELTAILCKRHNISVENIRQHNNWSGKNCPQMIRAGRPYNWDTFISKVRGFLETPPEREQITVKVDLFGAKVVEVPGWLEDGTNYVAIRALLEAMEFDVDWDNAAKTVLVRVKQ